MKNKNKKKVKKSPRFKRKVDSKLPYYGEIDFEDKIIRVNPRKGDLINTILHEEMHRRHPKMTERNIRKKTDREEKKLTVSQIIKLIEKYKGV